MEENPSRAHLKRPLPEDDDSEKPSMQKRARFPKGKKVKPGEEKVDVWKPSDDVPNDRNNPRFAVKERARRRSQITAGRNQITAELLDEDRGMLHDISAAEVYYEEDETFVDDGVQFEPFNLEQEREEGYFDENGNFVEYIDNEIKDAWLENVKVDPRLAGKGYTVTNDEDDIPDLSGREIGEMKRRIADMLEPGETILQALKRLKGSSSNKKEKMSAETKLLFEQLTDDAIKLMDNGDYNVYSEKQEVFQREAEGYERLARTRGEGSSIDAGPGGSSSTVENVFALNLDTAGDPSNTNVSIAEISSSNGDDAFDIFAEDEGNVAANPTSNDGGLQNDYLFDESSGYYYSSSSGYYYDPSSGLYCCAASGQWYSYNEATSSYDVIQEAASDVS